MTRAKKSKRRLFLIPRPTARTVTIVCVRRNNRPGNQILSVYDVPIESSVRKILFRSRGLQYYNIIEYALYQLKYETYVYILNYCVQCTRTVYTSTRVWFFYDYFIAVPLDVILTLTAHKPIRFDSFSWI